jgi:hypothetical protein
MMKIPFLRWALAVLLSAVIVVPVTVWAGKPSLLPPQTVLLINGIDAELSHSHMGVTAFSTSDRKIDNDWNMPEAYTSAAERMLTEAGHMVRRVEPPIEMFKALGDATFMKTGWSDHARVRPQYANWFKAEMVRHGATVVIVLWAHRQWLGQPGSGPTYQGYGFFSSLGDPPLTAALHANIGVIAVSGEKLVQLPTPSAVRSRCYLKLPFESLGKSSVKDVSAAELLPHREALIGIGERSIHVGFEVAGLIAAPAPGCDTIRMPVAN